MNSYEEAESEASLRGQAEIWKHMFALVDSLALKCAIELGIPDIIHSNGGSITLSQLASSIHHDHSPSPPPPDTDCLERIMRFLVYKHIFTSSSDGGDPSYGLTHSSKWLVTASDSSMSPFFLAINHSHLTVPWHVLSQCIRKDGNCLAFEKTYGRGVWEVASQDHQFNQIINDGMACNAKILIKELKAGYKDGFDCLGSLVDVAGGIGGMISEIVKSYPHIKGINFDLPHVIATAPAYDGVSHVAGDMFDAIPPADAVVLKWVLHDWNDEACVKILKNCRKAIPEKSGKVIILDLVLKQDGNNMFDGTGLAFDLVMMVNTTGGKERTELEWKKLLGEGGFPHYKIIKIPALHSIIEAYPQ